MPEEFVILVDEHDRRIGTSEKVRCHLPDGKLHRAFTALLFDRTDGDLVLARRARQKMLWPGCWDGTFASHPREFETYVLSAQRRMPEELGIDGVCVDYMHKFEYHVPYKDIGSENEICATLVGMLDYKDSGLTGIGGEIDQIRLISAERLLSEMQTDVMVYCPWMLIALALLPHSEHHALEKHSDVLSTWLNDETRTALLSAIDNHLPKDKWRILNP